MAVELLQLPEDVPRTVPSSAKIYKDECMFTFDTPENCENGLDVDLKTYCGYSRTDSHNFTMENFDKTGNRYYLNINKTAKPISQQYTDSGEKSSKIPKLEVKDIRDEDLYDTKVTIYDVVEDKYYTREQISQEFNQLIDKILNSNSSNRDDEIKQWEQEIFPCDHSLDVEQVGSGQVDLSKCTQCDLQENLWICLHCGAIGCGRSQFGSSVKGNSHALAHYELAGHPIAVKLGSLSENEDSCDAYCYQDNTEVKVKDLAKKLSKFGINLQETVKTEKSLIELNIDQNMNWDFNVDGDDSQPVFGSGLTGMTNLGNSCYLNSVIQSLYDLPQYQKYFENEKFPTDVNNPAKDLFTQLIKLYDGLWSGRYSKLGSTKGADYQIGIKPVAFKTLVGENHPEFQTQKQQDAFEFLIYLLEKIDNELGLKLNESLKFLLSTKIICSNCKKGSLNDELIDSLSVQVEDEVVGTSEDGKKIYKPVNLLSCIANSLKTELIEGFNCENCHNTPGEAQKSSGFKTFPENLIINTQRIKLENWVPTKIDVPIDIPYELDLSNLTAPKFSQDEKQLPKKETKPEFIPNPEALGQLRAMGFPEARCVKALYYTGNTNNAEDAMNWIFGHMEDIDIDEPLDLSNHQQHSNQTSKEPPQDLIDNLAVMGFSPKLCKKALFLHNNDPNVAVEWLFNNPDDDGEIEESKPAIDISSQKEALINNLLAKKSVSSKYKVSAIICHKGSSPHTGHYVVFIRRLIDGQERWVLFNDEKVVVCSDDNLQDLKSNAYIYIFKNC